MRFQIGRALSIACLAVISMGCEPRPAVIDTDDGGTTVVEDDDADVNVVPNGDAIDPVQPDTNVNLQVDDTDGTSGAVNPPPADTNSGAAGTGTGAGTNQN